ncbi:CRISPR-associated protein Csm2 [Candidatus Methanomarinus sp.]|jgi:CRISPR-associated protein Csm2|nr:CRISPR-associated protein Csm2 [ANME-2 cluster archaeon]
MTYRKQIPFDKDIDKILKGIEKLDMFKDLDIKLLADEGEYADTLANKLRNMKTTQLRRFFGAVKEIESNLNGKSWEDVEADFYLLKPKLAYAKGRKLIPAEFYEVVKTSMNKVDVGNNQDKIANYKMFVRFLESIVAYHKFYWG